MKEKPKSKLEMIATEAEKKAKEPKHKPKAAAHAACPMCGQAMPDEAGAESQDSGY